MKTVTKAKHAGFCPGVARAVDMALAANRTHPGKVYLYGKIAHNASLVEKLDQAGLKTIHDWHGIEPGILVIRSHGLAPKEKKELVAAGWTLIDATCPFVESIHRKARRLVDEGYSLVVIGKPDHPEVLAFCQGDYGEVRVVSKPEDVKDLPPKVGLVMQSTFPPKKAKPLISEVFFQVRELKAAATFCNVTAERLSAALQLAEEVDMIIIVGGRDSSNTQQLTEACREKIVTYHIETADEIEEDWLVGKTRIGVTAGASTPEWLINETIQRLLP